MRSVGMLWLLGHCGHPAPAAADVLATMPVLPGYWASCEDFYTTTTYDYDPVRSAPRRAAPLLLPE